MKIFIVIPAHNEAETIADVINGAKNYVSDIVVIDDASDDKTESLAKGAGAQVISLTENVGYDKALDEGFKYAVDSGAEAILTMDADGQHPSTNIPVMISSIKNKSIDLVIATRAELPRFSEVLFSYMSRFLYSIKDITCGMKCYKSKLYNQYGFISDYSSIGTWLSLKSIRNGASYITIPIKNEQRKGESRFGITLKAEFSILKSLVHSIFIN